MDENVLDYPEVSSESVSTDSDALSGDSGTGEDSGSTDLSSGSDLGDSQSTTVIYNMEYDEDLGGYPVVIVNDLTELEASTFALPSGSGGYQVSDYWINYFRGVLQKNPFQDYLAFSTREYYDSGSSYNNYLQHYWLYVGDLENGGNITVYDCYAVSSVYYVNVSTEYIGAVDVNSYDTLVYSNLGHVADFRQGGGTYATFALLFFLGFFTVFVVCRDFFRNGLWRLYGRKRGND